MSKPPKPRRKSAKHRALSAERKLAEEAGALPQWYAAREASRAPPAPPPPANPFDNYEAISTLEGASWDDRGYMVWRLPVHELTHIRRRAYIPRLTPNT